MDEQKVNHTILIADDSPVILDMLQYMLQEMEYNVVMAQDGLEAIEKTYDHHPDLIILDILMPKMNGYQVCRLLKEDSATKHIPIIILTSKIEKSHRFWGIETGADSYLTKDFEPEQLFDEIAKLLPESRVEEREVVITTRRNITLANVLEQVNLLLDRKLFQSTIVNEIRRISQSRIDLEETTRLLLHMLDSICDFSIGSIVLDDDPTMFVAYVPLAATAEAIEEFKMRTFEGMPDNVQIKGEPIIKIMQCKEDADQSRPGSRIVSRLESFLFLPMMMRGDFFGGVALASDSTDPWQEETLDTLRIFAKEAVLVLNQAMLMKNLQKSHLEIQSSNEHLKQMNERLESMLKELKDTQTQLVQSEKMASLGQLIAGVAHEINTPAGAIVAAISNIKNYVKEIARDEQLMLTLNLSDADQRIFFEALEASISSKLEGLRLSTLERRKRAKELEQALAEKGLDDYRSQAKNFASLNIDEKIPSLVDMIARLNREEVMDSLVRFNNMAESVRDIKLSIDAITRLVKALKTYSHLDQSEVARVDIHEGIDTTLTIMHNQLKYGIDVVKNFVELPPLVCYANELNQVWTNIIHNAIQAMGGRGTMIIDTTLKDTFISVTITDSGPGIPPEIKDKIFEPFFTTKKAGEGTGMGLGLVKQIIDKHHGSITVQSVPGKTSFEVLLPVDGVQLDS